MLILAILIPIIINALILAAAIWIVARHEADFEWWKLLFVSIGISVVNQILAGCVSAAMAGMGVPVEEIWGALAVLAVWGVLALAASAWIVHHYLCLMFRDALVASVIYMVISIGINIGVMFLRG